MESSENNLKLLEEKLKKILDINHIWVTGTDIEGGYAAVYPNRFFLTEDDAKEHLKKCDCEHGKCEYQDDYEFPLKKILGIKNNEF